MGYPTKLLADDEHIVREGRPHWRALIAPVVVFLVTIGIGTYLLAKVSASTWMADSARWLIAIVMLVAFVGWVVRPFLYWYTTLYALTDRRVIVRTGLFAKHGRDMPLARINDVSFSHSIIDQALNCGSIMIETAGERGQMVIRSVPDVEVMQREIYRLMEADELRRRRAASGPEPVPPGDDA
jgi:uncharacterized membrane protein YdbT with pleckstrin-like domain